MSDDLMERTRWTIEELKKQGMDTSLLTGLEERIMSMTSHSELMKSFDALEADTAEFVLKHEKLKRDRKQLLDVASDARDVLAKHLRSRTMTRADFEFAHNKLVAAIAQAESEE